MKVSIEYRDHEVEPRVFHKAVNAIGATPAYPYWVIWEEIDELGDQTVTFIDREVVAAVSMFGPHEEQGQERAKDHLNVVPFNRGGPDGTIS